MRWARVAAALFPPLYLGLPLGALVAIREMRGPRGAVAADADRHRQRHGAVLHGRAFGRRPLAPAISPKKTIEGAIGGFVFGALLLAVAGALVAAERAAGGARACSASTIVALGIVGDLFESMLKRSAGVKDSSTLIPGHGGVLDRIDALLFAAPVYYVVLQVRWLAERRA